MITIKYSCDGCGLNRRDCIIPEREEGQDVVDWMKNTLTDCIRVDHQLTSPSCTSNNMREVMIPTPKGTTAIGIKPVKI